MPRTVAIAVVLLSAGFALLGCGGAVGTGDSATDPKLAGPSREELLAEGPLGERALGKPNAPVTVIEYVSLTCPHCRNFHRDVFPRLKRDYIDTGKVRFIIREFPIGRVAGTAAIITRCVPEKKYFTLVNAFLSRQPEWVSQDVRPDAIYAVAKSSGISREAFDKCLSNQTIIDGLTKVKERGRKFRVIGTPTLFVNGQKAQGAVTFEQVKAMIEPHAS